MPTLESILQSPSSLDPQIFRNGECLNMITSNLPPRWKLCLCLQGVKLTLTLLTMPRLSTLSQKFTSKEACMISPGMWQFAILCF